MKSPGPDNYTGEYECEMWDVDHKESWALKNWWFWTVVLEKTLKSSLENKEIKLVNLNSWMHFGRTDAEAKVPIVWTPDEKSLLMGKDPDAGKDWGQGKGWQRVRWLDRSLSKLREIVKGQGSLACCSTWHLRVGYSLATEQVLYLLRQRSLNYTVNIPCNSQIVRIKTEYLKCSSIWKSHLHRISYFNINKKSEIMGSRKPVQW